MSKKINSEDAENILREKLEQDGYALKNKKRLNGENGVDILATKKGELFHIEVIGYKKSGPARSKDFFEIFFRSISRLNDHATHCIIALPKEFECGLPQRVRQYKCAWKRIEDAFPEIEIWLIDVENKLYQKTKWGSWSE